MQIILHVLFRWRHVIFRRTLQSILPQCFFYPHELQNNREIDNIQTKSCDNLADLFTKSIPYPTFSKCVEWIGMRRLRDLQESGRVCLSDTWPVQHHIAFFYLYELLLIRFSHVKFLMRQYQHTHMLYHLSIHFFLQGFFLEEDVCMTDSLDMILILQGWSRQDMNLIKGECWGSVTWINLVH